MARPPRTSLRRPRGTAELDRLADWLGHEPRISGLTADLREDVTADSLAAAISAGAQIHVVADAANVPIGMANWRCTNGLRSYEFSLVIGEPAYWLSGLGAEAAMQVVDHLFMTMDAHRVSVSTGAHNPYVSPALARAGFTLDGVLRDVLYLDGRFHDLLVWSLLEDEHRLLLERSTGTPFAYRPVLDPSDLARAERAIGALLADPTLARSWAPLPLPAVAAMS